MSIKLGLDPYAALGLTENPFLPQALSPDDQGERLLVGRDEDVQTVAMRLHKKGKITCLDGHVGVGKTSLVNVAAYKCFKAFLSGDTTQLLIPSITSYQLKKDGNADQFCTEVFTGIARTLIYYKDHLTDFESEVAKKSDQINAWLNSPIVQHLNITGGGSITIGMPGVASGSLRGGGSTSSQVNQSAGFAQSGIDTLVKQWLEEIFGTKGLGGVVCVIDNIELLETGTVARRLLETLRDKLFNVHGIRWVFCGANGVIHSLAASPRLTAYLSTPIIEVENIDPSALPGLIRARLSEFSTDPERIEGDLPIDIEDLKRLYMIVNFNLRDLLALADEYCEDCAKSGKPLRVKEKKREKFEKWLHRATFDRYQSLQSRISANAWAVLDIAMSTAFSGTFGAGDFGSFNQNSMVKIEESTFLRWLRELVKLGLLSKSIDEEKEDGDIVSRDVFTVTAKGALVEYARRKKNETFSIMPASDSWMRRVHSPKS